MKTLHFTPKNETPEKVREIIEFTGFYCEINEEFGSLAFQEEDPDNLELVLQDVFDEERIEGFFELEEEEI